MYLSQYGNNNISMEQLNKPNTLQQGAYWAALIVGGIYGWGFGHEFGGVVLGIVLAIVGALIASALVAVIASFFKQ